MYIIHCFYFEQVEKLKQETEPEKPSWMKEVAAKKMKAPADTDSVDSMEGSYLDTVDLVIITRF